MAVIDWMHQHSAFIALDKCWQVTVHMIEVGQAQERCPLYQLEPATGVWRSVLEHAAAQAIGESRSPALAGRITTVHPVSCDEFDAVGIAFTATNQCDHAWDIGGVILAVAVERHQPVPMRGLGGVIDRSALPERTRLMQDSQLIETAAFQVAQFFQRVVGTTIVDHDNLVRFAIESCTYLVQQRW